MNKKKKKHNLYDKCEDQGGKEAEKRDEKDTPSRAGHYTKVGSKKLST